MSGTIQATLSVRIQNGSFNDYINPPPATIAETNVGQGGYIQTIPTSDTAIAGLSGLTANGYAFLQNLDPTNYIVWGPASGGVIVPLGKLKPGEWAWVRIAPSVVLHAQANTAGVQLLVKVYED